MTCSFHVSLLFDLSIKLLSELMILSSALMNSCFVADFGLRKREKFRFSIFDLRRSHLWSYWVEWELVLIVRLCSVTCQSIWYIICFDRSLSSVVYQKYVFNALLKLYLQQSESTTFQKSFQFLHEKMKFIIAMKNLKFFTSSKQSKDDATLKFNEFKQNVASFNLMCWSCKKMKYKINNLMYFNYAFRQETCNHDEKMRKEKVWCSSFIH